MRQKIKSAFYGFCMFSFCLLFFWSSAYGMNVRVENKRLSLNAEEQTLVSILESISQKTGIIFKSNDTLSEKMSVNVEGIEIEAAIKKLLSNKNYIFFYTADDKQEIQLTKVEIFNTQTKTQGNPIHSQELEKKELTANIEPSQIDENMKRVNTHWFYEQLKDKKKLVKDIILRPTEDPLLIDGAVITSISPDSIFNKIGLETGDIIQNINGAKIYSTKELIAALSNGQSAEGSIRIERFNPEKESTYPIYLELNP